MKQPLLLTALIFSGLGLNAQNIINMNDQVADLNGNVSNWTLNNSNDINLQQNVSFTNVQVQQIQVNNGSQGSSALQSFGNSGNKKNPNKVQTQQTVNSNPVIQITNSTNNNSNASRNRGNNFDINENVLDNTQANRGRGGNVIVNDNIQSNPVINDSKKTVASKPVVKEYQGLDFKPSGLSGRDYSNGGKLKKGQKNFYTPHSTKHKTVYKKKPSHKKVKHHTSKCAKW